jgi:phage anti-repressor protein
MSQELSTLFPAGAILEKAFTIDARSLHLWLGVETRFNDWFSRRINEYGFTQNVDFTVLKIEYSEKTRKDSSAVLLSVSMAKELSMVERSEKGKEARRYFLSCEQIALLEYPKLAAELERRDQELARKEQVILQLQGKKRKTPRILAPNYNVFDGHEPKWELSPIEELDEPIKTLSLLRQTNQQIVGLKNRAKALKELLGIEET